ncbi:rhomboid family intramembrane serine protease [Nitritalea halalkaliphila]|uniref:rhomboid family intramembrane serine protease n=1 Tax=Nitritalea halalkaliphila TaxID=590849 RepID=UPI001EE66D4A|nr:rhomboid family intramembrane serine protease [Nitritalea halalkaliphila]
MYGLASFLICLGFFRISIKALIISALTLFLYGSTLYGVIPTDRKISWESHLAGAAVGCVAAFRVARLPRLSRFSMEKR